MHLSVALTGNRRYVSADLGFSVFAEHGRLVLHARVILAGLELQGTPELKAWLEQWIAGKHLTVETTRIGDQYLGIVRASDGSCLNDALVAAGFGWQRSLGGVESPA